MAGRTVGFCKGAGGAVVGFFKSAAWGVFGLFEGLARKVVGFGTAVAGKAVGLLAVFRARTEPLANAGVATAAGAYLIGLPTYYTLFPPSSPPGQAPMGGVARPVLFGLWVAIALASGLVATAHSRLLDRLLLHPRPARPDSQRRQLDLIVAERALESILRCGTGGAPAEYGWTVYVYEPASDRLLVRFPREARDQLNTFRRGQGVVGLSFARGALVVATDDQVTAAGQALTRAQRAGFGRYNAVVAGPLRVGRFVVGVLAAASETNDRFFEKQPGVKLFEQLAEICGQLLEAGGLG